MKIFLPEDQTAYGLSKHSFLRVLCADAIGLATLSAAIGIFSLMPWTKLSSYEWMGILFSLAVISVGMWHVDGSPYAKTADCLAAVGWSIVLGAIFLSIDVALGHWRRPELSLFRAAVELPGPGFFLSLIVCPGITLIALGGFTRSLVLR